GNERYVARGMRVRCGAHLLIERSYVETNQAARIAISRVCRDAVFARFGAGSSRGGAEWKDSPAGSGCNGDAGGDRGEESQNVPVRLGGEVGAYGWPPVDGARRGDAGG